MPRKAATSVLDDDLIVRKKIKLVYSDEGLSDVMQKSGQKVMHQRSRLVGPAACVTWLMEKVTNV